MNIPLTASYAKCGFCKRQILVERGLNGSDHTLAVIVSCFDCLDGPAKKKVRDMYPNIQEKFLHD